VALSTTEVEYMAATHASKEASMVTKIVFRYWVGTTNNEIRL
jgi:hypothetical protein